MENYNPYGEDFVIDRIVLSDVMDSIVGLVEIVVPHEIDLVDDTEQDWIDDHSDSEVEFEPEMEQMHGQELTNLRVLKWLHDLPADAKKTILTIQDVDQTSNKYISNDRWSLTYSRIQSRSARSWAIDGDVDGYFCPRSEGRTHPHQKPYDKKIKIDKRDRRTGNR